MLINSFLRIKEISLEPVSIQSNEESQLQSVDLFNYSPIENEIHSTEISASVKASIERIIFQR
jgi:hypothetical protein